MRSMMKMHCDICGEVIPDHGIYYKCQKTKLQQWSSDVIIDVCKDCFDAMGRFKKEELKHE